MPYRSPPPTRRAVRAFATSTAAALVAALGACGLEVVGTGARATADAEAGVSPSLPATDGAPVTAPDATDAATPDAAPDTEPVDAGPDAEVPPVAAIYAASGQSLWQLDPVTKQFTNLGPQTDCNAGLVEEIAVDRRGALVATRRDNAVLYTLKLLPTTCTQVLAAAYPYSLTFAPRGTLAQNEDVLVGYGNTTGDYVRIDRTTGAQTVVTAGALGTYRPSGDLVAGGTKGYLAAAGGVGGCTGGGNNDCLLEVDLTTGLVVANHGRFGERGIYGLGYWGGKVYAFANGSGKTYVVTPSPFTVVQELDPPLQGLVWYGAGSTTVAPTQ